MEENNTIVNSIGEEVVLKTNKLIKIYGDFPALNGLEMTVRRGDIYGLVGENGSGKTTLFRAITGLIGCNSGNYELFGVKSDSKDFCKQIGKVGAIVEKPAYFGNMTALENLIYMQKLLGYENKDEAMNILDLVDLNRDELRERHVAYMSLGMKQRLAIAICLIKKPEIMILDEPMNGLDPKGIVELRNIIINLNRTKNITFIISSHILSELSLMATRFGIIMHGRVMDEICKADLKKYFKTATIINTDDNEKAFALIVSHYPEIEIKLKSTIIMYNINNYSDILKVLLDNGITIISIDKKEAKFEDYYMRYMEGSR